MIIVDVETTGLIPSENCIVSLGAVDYATDREFYQECHVYDDTVIDPYAMKVNGYTEKEVRDLTKNPAHETYYDFQDWAKSLYPDRTDKIILAGHNVGHFDIQFLKELASYLHDHKFPFSYRTVDSHSIAYEKFGESLTLDGIGAKYGLDPEEKPHNALNGAKYCKRVFKHLFTKLDEYYK